MTPRRTSSRAASSPTPIVGDGHSNVYVLALNDDYGTGLADDFTDGVSRSGGATVVGTKIYDPKAADYSAEVEAAKAADPDAIVLIGFDESSKHPGQDGRAGRRPPRRSIYGVDGNMGNALAENFEAASSPDRLERVTTEAGPTGPAPRRVRGTPRVRASVRRPGSTIVGRRRALASVPR